MTLRRVKSPLDVLFHDSLLMTCFLGLTRSGPAICVAVHMPCTVNTVWNLHSAMAGFPIILRLPLQLTSVALHHHWPFGQSLFNYNSTMSTLNCLIPAIITCCYVFVALKLRQGQLASFS